jgi:hypothetical protein
MDEHQARSIGSVPDAIGQTLGIFGLQGGAWTSLRMRELVQCRDRAFHQLMAEVDRIIAV